jgi:threonine synthase
LLKQGWIKPDERVLLFNTGSGLKYAHLWAGYTAREVEQRNKV